MKKILTSLFLILSLNSFGQDWQERIARDFYSRIDSSKSFECCDKVNKAVSFEFIFDTYEMPYNSPNEVFDMHYRSVMDVQLLKESLMIWLNHIIEFQRDLEKTLKSLVIVLRLKQKLVKL